MTNKTSVAYTSAWDDAAQGKEKVRHDWSRAEVQALFALPWSELVFEAHRVHRQYFNPNEVQVSTLLSIKTGACPEDCQYCSQSGHYRTDLEKAPLMKVETVLENAHQAKLNGATRFCMGAAWRSPPKKEMAKMVEMIKQVKNLGLETCMTLGMLDQEQAEQLAVAGLDFYNHNLDTSKEHYAKIITTRSFEERLETLANVREAGIKVCCGGILGLGESEEDRIGMLLTLANLPEHPESVPINRLVAIAGTPLEDVEPIEPFDFIRTLAVARIMMPQSMLRLSAGREQMNDQLQAWCFFVGANSIFYGDALLTTANNDMSEDQQLFKKLNISSEQTPTCENSSVC